MLLNAKSSRPSTDAITPVDDTQEFGGDGVEERGDDHAVHAGPRWISGA